MYRTIEGSDNRRPEYRLRYRSTICAHMDGLRAPAYIDDVTGISMARKLSVVKACITE